MTVPDDYKTPSERRREEEYDHEFRFKFTFDLLKLIRWAKRKLKKNATKKTIHEGSD